MDINKLAKALDDDNNSKYLDLTYSVINDTKKEVLGGLNISTEQQNDFMKKLEKYIYIDEINNIKEGAYIRWIELDSDTDLKLVPGGIVCETKVTEQGLVLICKNFVHKYFEIKIEDSLIFQKLSEQEQILLAAVEYLSK